MPMPLLMPGCGKMALDTDAYARVYTSADKNAYAYAYASATAYAYASSSAPQEYAGITP